MLSHAKAKFNIEKLSEDICPSSTAKSITKSNHLIQVYNNEEIANQLSYAHSGDSLPQVLFSHRYTEIYTRIYSLGSTELAILSIGRESAA